MLLSDMMAVLANEPFCLPPSEIRSLTPALARVLYFRDRDSLGRIVYDGQPPETMTPWRAFYIGKKRLGWSDKSITAEWERIRRDVTTSE